MIWEYTGEFFGAVLLITGIICIATRRMEYLSVAAILTLMHVSGNIETNGMGNDPWESPLDMAIVHGFLFISVFVIFRGGFAKLFERSLVALMVWDVLWAWGLNKAGIFLYSLTVQQGNVTLFWWRSVLALVFFMLCSYTIWRGGKLLFQGGSKNHGRDSSTGEFLARVYHGKN